MAAKSVRVSSDGVTYYTLPGSTAGISSDSATVDDSIFGTTFNSTQPTLISWSVSTNGFFKGFPGYKAVIKRAGTPTAFTGEASTAHDGGFYITDRVKSVWEIDSVTVNDGGTPVDANNIKFIDYLHGGVVFEDAYTPGGAITFTGNYLPMTRICYAQTFSLTQSADTENITDMCQADDNNGYGVYGYQRQTAELTLDGFYSDTSGFLEDLLSREEVLIEINPDGEGQSVVRGYFRATSHNQDGDVGSTETESVTYSLSVPEGVAFPFKWYHASNSAIPQGVLTLLSAWEDRVPAYFEYTAENSTKTRSGQVLISDASLDGGVEAINEFTFELQGSGELTST